MLKDFDREECIGAGCSGGGHGFVSRRGARPLEVPRNGKHIGSVGGAFHVEPVSHQVPGDKGDARIHIIHWFAKDHLRNDKDT